MAEQFKQELVALQVLRQAIMLLATWVEADLMVEELASASVIVEAKRLLGWPESKTDFHPLKLLFGQISLLDSSQQPKTLYWPAITLANKDPIIPYPVEISDKPQLDDLEKEIRKELKKIKAEDWQNISFLALFLEKYTSHLSLDEGDIAYFDLVKMTAAVASAIIPAPEAENLCLVGADLSGIQDFIYTISSDGALKSLRARSFYLELVTEEIVQQLLDKLHLPRTSVIYSGGGNIYLLAPDNVETVETLEKLRQTFNNWLLNEFQGKVFLSLDSQSFPKSHVGTSKIAKAWSRINEKLSIQKARKFDDLINKVFEIKDGKETCIVLGIKDSHEPCRVCHRDDELDLQPLDNEDGPPACKTCRTMSRLGRNLFKVGAIVRNHQEKLEGAVDSLKFFSQSDAVYYHFFREDNFLVSRSESVYLINNWKLENYHFQKHKKVTPLLLGNYAQDGVEGFMTAEEFASKADGISRLGYLRMDVDRLGQIFVKGLGDHQNLPRLAGLSRQMSYFFKVYLNRLAEYRDQNFWQPLQLKPEKQGRRDLLFIYAGGDDLFVSGAWNQIVEFSLDVYQAFRAFTGKHPNITLSAGISIHPAKYPLYQAAEQSGQAVDKAKEDGRDRLSLFGEVFQWNEWLGQPDQVQFTAEDKAYLQDESMPELFGVLPFVQQLSTKLTQSYSRSFVHHLLITAQIQKRMVKEAQEKNPSQIKDTQYFLHLPRVAYTLARLPSEIAKSDIGTSLKSPRNARYFYAIATWISLLTRQTRPDRNLTNTNHDESNQQQPT
jgi:CRISPR-associated protein Csm1